MRIFVDVDNTLIFWKNNGIPQDQNSYAPNTKLIDFLERCVAKYGADSVIVCSGGGLEYAKLWGERLFTCNVRYAFKNRSLLETFSIEDVLIDNMASTIVTSAKKILPYDYDTIEKVIKL